MEKAVRKDDRPYEVSNASRENSWERHRATVALTMVTVLVRAWITLGKLLLLTPLVRQATACVGWPKA